MKRRCAVLLAAAMLLSAAGCAQDSKRPEPSEPAASAVSETSVENMEAAEETPQKPQSSRRFDDSRISTLYDERFTYTDPYGIEDTYFYQVPQIDDDTEGAKNINEMIGYRFGYLVERALDARSRNDFIDTSYIIWVSNWDGPLLSLQITSSDALTDPDTPAMTYTREGDLLTIEFDGMTMVFKRSDTKPEIDPALLDGGDDEYDIDGTDEPTP